MSIIEHFNPALASLSVIQREKTPEPKQIKFATPLGVSSEGVFMAVVQPETQLEKQKNIHVKLVLAVLILFAFGALFQTFAGILM